MNSWLGFAKDDKERGDRDVGVAFPEPVGPVDVALALGPACEPTGNMRRACWRALALIVIPVCYFAWSQSLTALFTLTDLQFYFYFAINFLQEVTFWLIPLLILAVAWASLAGRRGSSRGIQIWMCISLPLIGHAAINQMLDQSATLPPILRCAVLLVALLILGVWLDLLTVREYGRATTSFKLFQGYVALNRVAATVTLLIPLATAGLTIWNQIDNGVLHQKTSPTQVAPKVPGPSPSPSTSPARSHTTHRSKPRISG